MMRMCGTTVVVELSEVLVYIREGRHRESYLNTIYAPHANGRAFMSDPVRAELVYNHTLRAIKALLGTTEKRSRISEGSQKIATRTVLVPIPGVYSHAELKRALHRAVRHVSAFDGRAMREGGPGTWRLTVFGSVLWRGTKK